MKLAIGTIHDHHQLIKSFECRAQHLVRRRPPRLDLLLANLPQLVHRRGLACDGALCHIGNLANHVLGRDGIVSCNHIDADDTNAGVLRAAVVDAVAQVAEPGLELGAVVLLDQVAIGYDGGSAADRGPVARGAVEERDVDVLVRLEVIGLAGLRIGVEEEVDAAVFLVVAHSC